MKKEHVQVLIDVVDAPDSLGKQLKRADAAVSDAARAVGDLIVDIGRSEGGPAGVI